MSTPLPPPVLISAPTVTCPGAEIKPDYLDEHAHAGLAADAAGGRVSVELPRAVAKQFFMRVSLAEIRSRSGLSVWHYKAVILAGQVLAPALLLCCFVLIFIQSGPWLSALLVPLSGILWTVIAGFVNADGRWQSITVVTLIGIGLASAELPWTAAFAAFSASLWVHRMTFIAAQHFLTGLVTSSWAAYEMLTEHVTVTHHQ